MTYFVGIDKSNGPDYSCRIEGHWEGKVVVIDNIEIVKNEVKA